MLNLTSTKPELKVVFDRAGRLHMRKDLADAIFDIVENRRMDGNEGTYHYSNEGVCSWYDFTKMIAEFAGNTGATYSRAIPASSPPREAPLLLGARQNQVQGHFQCPCTLLDRLIEKMY